MRGRATVVWLGRCDREDEEPGEEEHRWTGRLSGEVIYAAGEKPESDERE